MHVAVLGAGYAGLTAVRTLERTLPKSVEITVVDERDTHLVAHLLHRVVRKPTLAEHIAVPVEECCRRATVRQARVLEVDADAGVATLDDGTLEYDVGVVSLGARTAFYGLPGLESRATPLKRLDDARQIREEFLDVLDTGGRTVVGGAGLSGVQVAGELAELVDESDDTDAGESNAVEVVLLEAEATVAPGFPRPFRDAIAEELTERGVDVRTKTAVESADEDHVTLAGGENIRYDQLVWTGGIAGQEALSGSRPQVRSTLRLGTKTFGVGDSVRVVDDRGEAVPASAQTAIRQAKVAARNVESLLEHAQRGGFEPHLERYTYDSRGWVVTIGDGTVAQVGSRVLRGTPARALKTTIGVQHLASVGAVEDAIEFAQDAFV